MCTQGISVCMCIEFDVACLSWHTFGIDILSIIILVPYILQSDIFKGSVIICKNKCACLYVYILKDILMHATKNYSHKILQCIFSYP